jgi:LmbE family N-acetylglucosaminyl deacetylase
MTATLTPIPAAPAATTPTDVRHLGTILGVWAHPDDEAYLSAGLMALARAGGQRVVIVSLTAGELGTDDPDLRGRRLASHRRAELAASLSHLGVEEHHVLGLPDGGCAALGDGPGAALVGQWIDEVRPDTVVTFGPEGLTGHPDHLAVHRWTMAAWIERQRAPRLLQATVTPDFHRRWGHVNEAIGLWEGDVPCTPDHELALAVCLQPDVLDRKVAALRAHDSQTSGLIDLIGMEDYRAWWATETFAEAAR